MLKNIGINHLYYFANSNNFDNILRYGILPKNKVNNMNLTTFSFANASVQSRREKRIIKLSDYSFAGVHDCVPLYMRKLTPTQYACKSLENQLIFFVFDSNIILNKTYAFSNGNVACNDTKVYFSKNKLDCIPVDKIKSRYWRGVEERRQVNSEVLIKGSLYFTDIKQIVVFDSKIKSQIDSILKNNGLKTQVIVDKSYYFDKGGSIAC